MNRILLIGVGAVAAMLSGGAAESRTVRNIAYADYPDCRLDVYVPPDATNFPTVVWLHGGGLTAGCRRFLPLTDKGIAQVAADYRLLGGEAVRGEECIEDAAAVAWTLNHIAEYGGDPGKVFLSGMSAGGYLTMMVAMDPQWLAAHGRKNTDLAGFVAISGQATKHFAVRKYSGDTDPQYLPKIDALAPLAHVSEDLPPFLCVCGQPPYEWKCRSEENRLLVASCVALGHKDAKFIELDYCDHGKAFIAGLPYLELFVKRICKPLKSAGTHPAKPLRTLCGTTLAVESGYDFGVERGVFSLSMAIGPDRLSR